MGSSKKTDGPDLTQGIALSTLADGGMLLGRVGDDEVLVARPAATSSRSARTARTITDRSPRA